MRLFVAVFPPAEVQRAAAAAIDALRRDGDGVSWVREANLHYTLRFLGEVGESGARRVADAAERAVQGLAAFDAELGPPGAFPSARRARVLWLGMARGERPLVELAQALETELRRLGFAKEAHAFSPHLTIGRVREPGHDWAPAMEAAGHTAIGARFRVDRLAVMESRLNPKGSIYTVRHEAKLAG
jgi:2'-5' RNA ligase